MHVLVFINSKLSRDLNVDCSCLSGVVCMYSYSMLPLGRWVGMVGGGGGGDGYIVCCFSFCLFLLSYQF